MLLGLLIFLSAQRLSYWQDWLYVGLFTSSVSAITFYLLAKARPLLERRMKSGATADPTKPQQRIQAVASLLVIALIVESSFDQRLGWSRVPDGVSACAGLAVLVAFYSVFQVFKENSCTAATIQVEAG